MSEVREVPEYAKRLQDVLDTKGPSGIARRGWGDPERACLLATMVPEVLDVESPRACPATVCPLWWAELTVWIDDAGSGDAWPGAIVKYARLAKHWHVLSPAGWSRLRASIALALLRKHHRRWLDEFYGRVGVDRVRTHYDLGHAIEVLENLAAGRPAGPWVEQTGKWDPVVSWAISTHDNDLWMAGQNFFGIDIWNRAAEDDTRRIVLDEMEKAINCKLEELERCEQTLEHAIKCREEELRQEAACVR